MNLAQFSRRRYTEGQTPLEKLPHFSKALGGPTIYIKRDDLLGLSSGGNKTRKLEFLVADALNKGAMNVVPGKVELGIDIRDINSNDKKQAVEKVQNLLTEIAKNRDLKIDYKIISDEQPVILSEKIISSLEREAQNAQLAYKKMISGAGHDAMYMTQITESINSNF